MATPPPIGSYKIKVDGQWDIADLQQFSESLLEAYSFLYHVVGDGRTSLPLRDTKFVMFEFEPDFDIVPWGRFFYEEIPPEQRIKIKAFAYSSPGVIEIAAILGVVALVARVVRAWVRTGDSILELLGKIDKYREQRRRANLRREMTAQEEAINLQQGRDFVFELGKSLGFTQESCNTLLEVAGGPLGALRLLVAVARQGQRLAELQQQGKLVFAEATTNQRQLPSSRTVRKRPPRRKKDEE